MRHPKQKPPGGAIRAGGLECVQLGSEPPSNSPTPVPAQGDNRLAVLAHEIAAAHDKASAGARQCLEGAIAAGKLLAEAKVAVGHRNWLRWVAENCTFSTRTCQVYMRVASHQGAINTKSADTALFTIKSVVEALADHRISILPPAGHVRVGLGTSVELWIAPSTFYTKHVFITAITKGVAGSDVVGLRSPVLAQYATEIAPIFGIDISTLEWHDEPFPSWGYNILLFSSLDEWISKCSLDEVMPLANGRFVPAEEPSFNAAIYDTNVSMYELIFGDGVPQ